MARVASFHLVRVGRGRAPLALVRLATDRARLRRVPGLAFWRLLGTGRGGDTGPSADLRRTALFAVWEDEADLDRFLDRSPIAARWAQAEEVWHVRLRAAGGHGRWRDVDVLAGLAAGSPSGPVAIVTRADVRWRSWAAFARAGRPVDGELHGADGLLAVVAVGEAPLGRLGTFSLWRSLGDARAFAASTRHRDVVRRTRADHWYGEELFARFEPYASSGRWDGRDPLGDGAA